MHSLRSRFGTYGLSRLAAARPRSLGLPIVLTPQEVVADIHRTGTGEFYEGQSQNTMPGNARRGSGLPGTDRAPKVQAGADGYAQVNKQAERANPQGRTKRGY